MISHTENVTSKSDFIMFAIILGTSFMTAQVFRCVKLYIYVQIIYNSENYICIYNICIIYYNIGESY